MKIISRKNGTRENAVKFPLRVCCEHCKSELEIDESDVWVGPFGAMWYTCGVCGEKCMADEIPGITLTPDNIEFPTHFYHFGEKAVELTPDEIKKYIKIAINYFRNNPENFCYYTGSGDTMVVVLNYSGDKEYHVSVAKGYYDIEIPYTDEDLRIQNQNNYEWKNKGIKKG